jgi:hypothetical protein
MFQYLPTANPKGNERKEPTRPGLSAAKLKHAVLHRVGPVLNDAPTVEVQMIFNRFPTLALATVLVFGTAVVALAQSSGGGSSGGGGSAGSAGGTGGGTAAGVGAGGSSMGGSGPGSSGSPLTTGGPSGGRATGGAATGSADSTGSVPMSTDNPSGGPRQGVSSGGSLGNQTGLGNIGQETERERRAQDESNRATRSLCNGC